MKQALKPFYAKQKISKDEYKEILRKAVPKVSACSLLVKTVSRFLFSQRLFVFYVENSFVALRQIYNSKSGGINPERIRTYVQAYVDKTRQSKRYAAKKVAREQPDTT